MSIANLADDSTNKFGCTRGSAIFRSRKSSPQVILPFRQLQPIRESFAFEHPVPFLGLGENVRGRFEKSLWIL